MTVADLFAEKKSAVLADVPERTVVTPLTDEEKREFAELALKFTQDIPYCPWTPNEREDGDGNPDGPGPQHHFLLDFGRESLYGGAAGGGKLLNLSTVIPTPTGWTTMGELKAGDEIFDERGNVCQVTVAHPVDLNPVTYRLTFDDKSTIDACEDHEWLAYDATELASLTRRDPEWQARRRASRPSRATGKRSEAFTAAITARNQRQPPERLPVPTGTIRTTKEIVDTLLTDRGRTNHAIPVAGALKLPDVDLPLDPYLLGVWLGDGTTAAGQITSMDPEVFQAFEDAGFPMGKVQTKGDNEAVTCTLLGLTVALRAAGVFGNKHVPTVYLRASIAQRLALLQGLLDTDGTATHGGSVSFTSTRKVLTEAVTELAISLGHKARMTESRATLNGVDRGPKWEVQFTSATPMFRLKRKLDRQNLTPRRTTRFRYITSCEPIPSVSMRCITVDSASHLYLAGSQMVPTHNSIAIMMAASQFLTVPGYSALLLRKSYADLGKPGALMDVAEQWWGGVKGIRFVREEHAYEFDVGGRARGGYTSGGKSKIVFGSLDNENDRFKYQGGAYHFIGFDELTQHKERDYRYLFSRMRRVRDETNPLSRIPIRMRATANPGGIGHDWVYKRFITQWEAWQRGDAVRPSRNFHPAMLRDNTKLDQEDYIASLMELDPITRAQLLRGDWNIRPDGRMFKRSKFKPILRENLPGNCRWVRFWDMASTEPAPGKDPDFTSGLLLGQDRQNRIFIADIRRWRLEPAENDLLCAATSLHDTRNVLQVMEQEPGASGKIAIFHYRNGAFRGSNFRAVPATGKGKGTTTVVSQTGRTPRAKIVAAGPVASAVDAEQCFIVMDGSFDVDEFLSEVEIFPDGLHDDQVDSISGAYYVLMKMPDLSVMFEEHNREFEDEQYWKPDATPNLSPSDLMTQQSLYGTRMEAERVAQRDMQMSIGNAWAM